MPTKRIFLDWKSAFLDSATDWFLEQAPKDCSHLDLSNFFVLSSVSRASRRLIEKLLFKSENLGLGFSPPQILSYSSTIKLLLPNFKIVSDIDSTLIFLSLLKESEPSTLFPSLDKSTTELQLLEKANFLSETYKEITKNAEQATTTIQKIIKSGLIANEDLWITLSEFYKAYKLKLKDNNLIDSVDALEIVKSKKIKNETPLVLLGTFDMPPVLQNLLENGFENIYSLIFASKDLHEGFDNFGRYKSEFWIKRDPKIDKRILKIHQSDTDQVEFIFDKFKSLPENTSASDITLGVLSEGLDKQIELKAKDYNLPTHLVKSANLLSGEPSQILLRTLHFIETRKFEDLSLLLILPSFASKISSSHTALSDINKFREEHLQPNTIYTMAKKNTLVENIINEASEKTSLLKIENKNPHDWFKACIKYLSLFFTPSELSQTYEILKQTLSDISANEISVQVLVSCIIDSFKNIELESSDSLQQNNSSYSEIDIIGWLELAFDDAKNTFILGANEGNLPSKPTPNPFLPDKIRDLTGLDTCVARMARDIYILEILLNSKPNLTINCAKISDEGDPLLLSSLFLRGKTEEKIILLKDFFTAVETKKNKHFNTDSSFLKNLFENLMPQKFALTKAPQFSVSAINEYLKCPYSFYLRYIKKLESLDFDSREMSALQFGNVMHAVLMDFGKSEIKDSSDARLIYNFLISRLDIHFSDNFGTKAFPEVYVQYHQITERLSRFSEWQSNWRQEGWKIKEVETSFKDGGYKLDIEKGNFKITGRIDRIDYNQNTKEYAIFDYKSSEKQKNKNDIFNKKSGWKDIQLAIYWLYSKEVLNIEASKIGIIAISAESSDISPTFLDASTEDFLLSKKFIADLAQGIYNQNFWPPKLKTNNSFDLQPIYEIMEQSSV